MMRHVPEITAWRSSSEPRQQSRSPAATRRQKNSPVTRHRQQNHPVEPIEPTKPYPASADDMLLQASGQASGATDWDSMDTPSLTSQRSRLCPYDSAATGVRHCSNAVSRYSGFTIFAVPRPKAGWPCRNVVRGGVTAPTPLGFHTFLRSVILDRAQSTDKAGVSGVRLGNRGPFAEPDRIGSVGQLRLPNNKLFE